jgi:hypothetical protein
MPVASLPSITPQLQVVKVLGDLVPRQGGHGVVNWELGQAGVDTGKTVGFTAFYEQPGALTVAWGSGSVNFANYQDYFVPLQFRSAILDSLQNATGLRVTSR